MIERPRVSRADPAVVIARDTYQSLSQALAGLIRRGLGSGQPGEIAN